jgi:hypothetical protein
MLSDRDQQYHDILACIERLMDHLCQVIHNQERIINALAKDAGAAPAQKIGGDGLRIEVAEYTICYPGSLLTAKEHVSWRGLIRKAQSVGYAPPGGLGTAAEAETFLVARGYKVARL